VFTTVVSGARSVSGRIPSSICLVVTRSNNVSTSSEAPQPNPRPADYESPVGLPA